MDGASVKYQRGVTFVHGISTSIQVLFCQIPSYRFKVQGFYWPLIGHSPVQAYFTYDVISPTWRTHDTECFTFFNITLNMGNIRILVHSFHHNRHYTDPKFNEELSGVVNIKFDRDAWLSVGLSLDKSFVYKLCQMSNYHFSSIIK